jgi:molybdate/tungstate transport system permease protein
LIPRWPGILITTASLGVLHLLMALLPGPLLTPATNLVLFAANLYVAYCAWLVLRDSDRATVGLFAAGYMVLFLLILVLLGRDSLFILLIILYASFFRVPLLLGLLVVFVLSYVVFQPYAFETFAPLSTAFVVVWWIKRSGASTFLVGCLSLGLFSLAAILLPLVHLLAQDSTQTLWYALSRPDVQSAIWLSLASSALATVIIALWGVPLAYALARSQFRGKGVIESLIDLPILIPQSVVGIALLVLLGAGSPLGQALDAAGLTVAGRFAGIVLAQVFVACPFLIKTAMTAFEGVPEHLEDVSRTLGARPSATFFRVALPLASRGVFVGFILSWARAISEFGAIILFAAHPQTAPVLAYNESLKAGGISEARPIAVVLLLVCLWVFVLLQFGKTFLPRAYRRGGSREDRR